MHGAFPTAQAQACVHDGALTSEERQLFSRLHLSAYDHHPDAHAARLRLSIVCRGTPCAPLLPWRLQAELDACLHKFERFSTRPPASQHTGARSWNGRAPPPPALTTRGLGQRGCSEGAGAIADCARPPTSQHGDGARRIEAPPQRIVHRATLLQAMLALTTSDAAGMRMLLPAPAVEPPTPPPFFELWAGHASSAAQAGATAVAAAGGPSDEGATASKVPHDKTWSDWLHDKGWGLYMPPTACMGAGGLDVFARLLKSGVAARDSSRGAALPGRFQRWSCNPIGCTTCALDVFAVRLLASWWPSRPPAHPPFPGMQVSRSSTTSCCSMSC